MNLRKVTALFVCAVLLFTSVYTGIISSADPAPFTPTPAEDLQNPPAVNEIVNAYGFDLTVGPGTVTGTPMNLNSGRAGSRGKYNMGKFSIVLQDVTFKTTESDNSFVVGFISNQFSYFDVASFFVQIARSGTVSLIKTKGNAGGFDAPFHTQTGFDFTSKAVEIGIRLSGGDYIVTVNGVELTQKLPASDPVFTEGSSPLKADAAFLTIGAGRGPGGGVTMNIANVLGGEESCTGGYVQPAKGNTGFTPTPPEYLIYPPAVGQIHRPGFIPESSVAVAASAAGTVIEVQAGARVGTESGFNMSDLSMVLKDIDFSAGKSDIYLAFVGSDGGWFDGGALFVVLTKDGKVKLSRGNFQFPNTYFKTLSGMDFSGGWIELALQKSGALYTLTVNGEILRFHESELDSQTSLTPGSAHISFGAFEGTAKFTVANITGGPPNATMPIAAYDPDFEFTPNDALANPPADGEIFPAWGAAITIKAKRSGTALTIPGGRTASRSTYNMNDLRLVLDNIVFSPKADSAVMIGLVRDSQGWTDGPALFLLLNKSGTVGIGIGGDGWDRAAILKTYGRFDFSGGRAEISIKRTGANYVIQVNDGVITLPASELDEILNRENPLNPAAAYLAFGKLSTDDPVSFTLVDAVGGAPGSTGGWVGGEPVFVGYTPTPPDEMEQPQEKDIGRPEFVSESLMKVEPVTGGLEVTIKPGARTNSRFYYDLSDHGLVLNNIQYPGAAADSDAILVGYATTSGGWYDEPSVYFKFYRDGRVDFLKSLVPETGTAGTVKFRNTAELTDTVFDSVIDMRVTGGGNNYVLHVNGWEIPFDTSTIMDNLSAGLDLTMAYLSIGATYPTGDPVSPLVFRVPHLSGRNTELPDPGDDHFDPTPADQLKNPPSSDTITNLWSTTEAQVSPAEWEGTLIRVEGGGRVGTNSTFGLEAMRLVINNIGFTTVDAGISVMLSVVENGWYDSYGIRMNFLYDGRVEIVKTFPGMTGNTVIVPLTKLDTHFLEVLELTFRLVGQEYVMTANGKTVKIPKTTLDDIFVSDGLDYSGVFLSFGAFRNQQITYRVADITGGDKRSTGIIDGVGDTDPLIGVERDEDEYIYDYPGEGGTASGEDSPQTNVPTGDAGTSAFLFITAISCAALLLLGKRRRNDSRAISK